MIKQAKTEGRHLVSLFFISTLAENNKMYSSYQQLQQKWGRSRWLSAFQFLDKRGEQLVGGNSRTTLATVCTVIVDLREQLRTHVTQPIKS